MESSPLPEGPAKSELQLTGSVGLIEGLLLRRGAGQVENRELRLLPQGLIHSPGGEGTLGSGRGLHTMGRSF